MDSGIEHALFHRKRKTLCPYTCPRCGYETLQKNNMRGHFYRTKRTCYGCKDNLVELTEEIKQHVLSNRVYQTNPPSINQTINNYNTQINYIAGIDVIEKLHKYMNHKNLSIQDYEAGVEERYRNVVKKMEEGSLKYGLQLHAADFLQIVDTVSAISNASTEDPYQSFNVMYDDKLNKIKIYDAGQWEEQLVDSGINKVVQILVDNYLSTYESYLVRKMEDTQHPQAFQCLKECLEEYYTFLACFKIDPIVRDNTDAIVFPSQPSSEDDEADARCEKYANMYWKVCSKLTANHSKEIKKQVLDIIKRNSEQNKKELNKSIYDLIKMDAAFRSQIINQ